MIRKLEGIAPILILVVPALIGLGIVSYLVVKPALAPASPTPTPTTTLAPTTTLDGKDPRIVSCENSGGKWLDEHDECEGMSLTNYEGECTNLGGKFYPCESVCRHDPDAEICIEVCVEVCKFNGRFCGGFAANLPEFQCPVGYECVGEGEQGPDSDGVCVKKK